MIALISSIVVPSKSIDKRSSHLWQSLFCFIDIASKFVACSASLKFDTRLSNIAVHALRIILAYFISALFVSDQEFNIVITEELRMRGIFTRLFIKLKCSSD